MCESTPFYPCKSGIVVINQSKILVCFGHFKTVKPHRGHKYLMLLAVDFSSKKCVKLGTLTMERATGSQICSSSSGRHQSATSSGDTGNANPCSACGAFEGQSVPWQGAGFNSLLFTFTFNQDVLMFQPCQFWRDFLWISASFWRIFNRSTTKSSSPNFLLLEVTRRSKGSPL